MEELSVRYFHFLGILMLVSCLVGEHLLITKEIKLKSFKKLIIVDGIYGLGAMITFVAGGLLWLSVGKPAEFYSTNILFHIKLTLFVLIGLLSIFPTSYFIRHRKVETDTIILPTYIIKIIRVEICLLTVIPLLAVLVARGIGN